MNVGFYLLVFHHVKSIGVNTGWGENEFFVFLATTWLINSIIQAFLMPNAQEFSELIRTGGLDFALLKPIDTQFLVSFRKVEWSALSNFLLGLVILVYFLIQLSGRTDPVWTWSWITFGLYWFYIGCGILLLYSLMMCLAATSIWLGRNQSLYDFWFYITNFSRYPMEILSRRLGNSALVHLHVLGSRSGRRQRPRKTSSSALVSATTMGVVALWLRVGGDSSIGFD